MWRTRRRWMDDLAKVLFKIFNQKSNSKTSWVINRVKTCIVKRDRRLLTSFSMWQNSLINRASPWELAKQFENNDARKISSIKIWNLVSQRMFQPFPHSLDRHYHWRSPNNSIKAGWGLKLSWRELPHAHRQYGMYDGICLIMSSSMRTCAENFGKLGPELKVQNYHYWSSSSSSSPALVLVSLQACSIVRPGSRHRSARSSPWGLRAWCPCCLTITSLRSRCLPITSFCSSEKARSLRNLYPTTCRATFNLESVHQRSTKPPWQAGDRCRRSQQQPPRRLWRRILGSLTVSPWTSSDETWSTRKHNKISNQLKLKRTINDKISA